MAWVCMMLWDSAVLGIKGGFIGIVESECEKRKGVEEDPTLSGLEAENKLGQPDVNSSLQGNVFSRHPRVFCALMFLVIRLAEQVGHLLSQCFPMRQEGTVVTGQDLYPAGFYIYLRRDLRKVWLL